MEKNIEKPTGVFSPKHAIYFGISLLAMILFFVFAPAFFWVALPFVCTYFVQMFGWLGA